MPFETTSGGLKRIAVIGAGISGMGAAYLLADHNRVTLFEAGHRLGGHARTVIAGKHGDQPVDTGFIVFNHANYPRLSKLFEELGVVVKKSDMSFAASVDSGRIEYSLRTVSALFAQRRNLFRPSFLRMTRDILRFNARAVEAAGDSGITIGALIGKLRLGDWFRNYYLAPLSGAIWSTPPERIMDFPARAFVEFFKNHALLDYSGQHQWLTVDGGSIQYVTRLRTALKIQGVDIRLSSKVAAVYRDGSGIEIRTVSGDRDIFDEVVFATHSDDTLAMLKSPTPEERRALGTIRYQSNEMILHADAAAMPCRRSCWSSWNYIGRRDSHNGPIGMTYWMNSLQSIPADDPIFVTLNSQGRIRDELIYDTETFRHPVYDLNAWAAQDEIRHINGQNRTWFCGAWLKNGFHEDGYSSAHDVAEAMGCTPG